MTKEFLNEEKRSFDELTREEKHFLFDAVLDKNCQVYDLAVDGWYNKEQPSFYDHAIYRTKPKSYKKLDIPWQFIKPALKYAAMDSNGTVWLYQNMPKWWDDAWNDYSAVDGSLIGTGCLQIDTTDVIAQHSLTERPEGV